MFSYHSRVQFFRSYISTRSHQKLQRWIANALFPVGKGDWYALKGYGKNGTSSFDDFVTQQQKPGSLYSEAFNGLSLTQVRVKTQLANGTRCDLESVQCVLNHNNPLNPGSGKHIIYFPGANTYYQACFRDISTAAKVTGATIHAFNFPGTGASTGKVSEANDLINAGIGMVQSLRAQGIPPDDIILLGDCYGAGIALEVKKQFESQSGIHLRLIMNNAFKSFKAVLCNMILSSPMLPDAVKDKLKALIKKLLQWTGWNISPGKRYEQSGPYQCHIQHFDDATLMNSTLSNKVQKYRYEMESGVTLSKKRKACVDKCPTDYKADQIYLDNMHLVRVSPEFRKTLSHKFGTDSFGRVNAHFADLCELETFAGQSVYKAFVNYYLEASNRYIANHSMPHSDKPISYLKSMVPSSMSASEISEMEAIAHYLEVNEPAINHGVHLV